MVAITTHDVDFRYGRQFRIEGLSLRVEEGDIYGFLGPNGAGKTTIIRLLLGLLRPRRGAIHFFGEALGRGRPAVMERIGTHLEGHAFYPYLSGRDNLTLFSRYHGAPDRARIDMLLERVGLAAAAAARVRTYSLGMKQRLGLAQALLARPRLLILDEPLNGLDPPGVIEVRELLLELNRAEGMTIFLSSHRLEEAERVCNRIGLVRAGRLVCEGDLEALLSTGERRVYRLVTGDNEAAATRLEAEDCVAGVTRLSDALELDVHEVGVARVPRILIDAGHDLLEYRPWRPGLEDLFRRYQSEGAPAPGYSEGASAPGYSEGASAPGHSEGASAPGHSEGASAPGEQS